MKSVLIVDDERSIRETLTEFLVTDGFDVAVAGTDTDAFHLLDTQAYDVVVADIILPGGSGLDLLDYVRKLHANTQVILITGEPTLESATRGLRGGAFDYLAKPVTGAHIRQAVAEAVKAKDHLDEASRLEAENQQYQKRLAELVGERSQQLHESEERFRSLVEYSSDAILLTDEAGIVIEWNASAERILGLTREEALGRTYADIEWTVSIAEHDPESLREAIEASVSEALATGEAPWLHEARDSLARTPAGAIRHIQSRTFPIQTQKGFRLGSILRDVTPPPTENSR